MLSRRTLLAPLLAIALAVGAAAPAAQAATNPPSPESDAPATLVPDPGVTPAPAELGISATTGEDLTATIVRRLTARQGMTGLGTGFSGRVTDSTTNHSQWQLRGTTTRMPASTMKLVTAYTALRVLGPDHRFGTPALQGATYRSTIYLRGVGDPRLNVAGLRRLAQAVASKVRAQGISVVNVKVDDSLFPSPSNATGWKTSYLPDDVAPVRSLVVNSHDVYDTAIDAGNVFAGLLRTAGLPVRTVARKTTPAAATTLAVTTSGPLSTIIGRMVNHSQNDYAEILLRDAALKRVRSATWSAATSNATSLLVADGVGTYGFRMYDGSGLSRANRMPTATLTSLLFRIQQRHRIADVLLPSTALPVSGETGTLASRYLTSPTSCAAGRIHAKTGTLMDVVALSGYADGADGGVRSFAFLVNGVTSRSASVKAVDIMAATVTGCY